MRSFLKFFIKVFFKVFFKTVIIKVIAIINNLAIAERFFILVIILIK